MHFTQKPTTVETREGDNKGTQRKNLHHGNNECKYTMLVESQLINKPNWYLLYCRFYDHKAAERQRDSDKNSHLDISQYP